MAVETDFSFAQEIPGLAVAGVGPPPDLLGLLRPFVGKPAGGKDAKRSWKGTGFNMIWRPNFGGEFGPTDFFLQLNFTDEQLDFTEITGTGIANRSLFEKTVVLGGAAYTQAIKDSFDQSGQHFEPGVWANVPAIANPAEPPTVVRMGSIPHGTTINLQGVAFQVGQPHIRRLPASRLSGSEAPTTGRRTWYTLPKRISQRTARHVRTGCASQASHLSNSKIPICFCRRRSPSRKSSRRRFCNCRPSLRIRGSDHLAPTSVAAWRISRFSKEREARLPAALTLSRDLSPPRSGSKNSPTGAGSCSIRSACCSISAG